MKVRHLSRETPFCGQFTTGSCALSIGHTTCMACLEAAIRYGEQAADRLVYLERKAGKVMTP